MRILYPKLNIHDMAGITQKSSVTAFSLSSLLKQNGWVKRSEINMKDIMVIPIAY